MNEIFHCTRWQQHKPYLGLSLQHTLKGSCQRELMVQLDRLLGDIDSRKPLAYLSPRNSTFAPCFLSMTHCPTQCMASLSVSRHSFRDVQILIWEMKTGKKHYLNDTSLKAIWQGRVEFSPLTETAFNQAQNLSENSVSAIAVTESWGGSDLGRNPSG